jgi:hypothetical protein
VTDAQVLHTGLREVDVHVPAAVDDRGHAQRVIGQERAHMVEARDDELAQVYPGKGSKRAG